jgi:hypothetical protein
VGVDPEAVGGAVAAGEVDGPDGVEGVVAQALGGVEAEVVGVNEEIGEVEQHAAAGALSEAVEEGGLVEGAVGQEEGGGDRL